MPTDLDRRMDAAIAAMTGPGGRLALEQVERDGRLLPAVADAPPSLPAFFAEYGERHRDRVFLVAGTERLTFGEVLDAARAAARSLVARMGVRPGDRVGIAIRNSPAWIALYMAVLSAGGIATLLNGWWQTDELDRAVRLTGCTLIFADDLRAERLRRMPGDLPRIIEIDDEQPLAAALAGVGHADDAATPLPVTAPEDPATILFTSGSTGQSQGALSCHRAVVQATLSFVGQTLLARELAGDGAGAGGQPVVLLNLPLFHVTAEITVLLQSFVLGRRMVLMRRWDAGEAMRLIEAERVSYFTGVPLMSFELLTHPDRDQYDLSSVTDFSAGGAPRPVAHVRRIAAELPGAPLIGYGLTETNAVGASNRRSNYLAKPASTGRPVPLVEIAVFDKGRPVAQGCRGEVGIRSICTVSGYWNNLAATAAAFTPDGFFLTGDIGYLDEDGYLFIVDRKKDMVIRGGENIACQEVEAALYACAGVGEAAVFGLPDEALGEVPGAVVHPLSEGAVTEAGLRAQLSGHLAAFKVPVRIWLSPLPLPRLGSEKINKAALRRQYGVVWADERLAAVRDGRTA